MLYPSDIAFICASLTYQFLFSSFVLALVPVLIIRWCLVQIRMRFSSDVKKFLNGISCTYTADPIEQNPGNNVIFCLKLDGKLNVAKTLEKISELVYRGEIDRDGNPKPQFPELQMYWTKWFGYPIWKPEKNFNVNKHVIHAVIPNRCDKEEFITHFEKDIVKKPFKSGQSPWEIVLVDGIDQPQCWYWLFKFHHSLADGHSIFKALMTCSDNYVPLYEPPKQKPELIRIASYPWVGLYEWIKLALDSTLPNPWKIPIRDMSADSRLIEKSRCISTNKIICISSEKNVPFTAVLMSGITCAIRNTIRSQRRNIPEYIVARMPVPAPIKHAEGLTNNFTAVFMKLPTGIEDSEFRLKKCKQELKTAKDSTCSTTSFILTNLLGMFPSFVQKMFPPNFQTIQIGNFPGPKELIYIGGQAVLDMHFVVWCAKRNPMYLSVLSYNGNIRFVANVDPHVFYSDMLLMEFVHEIERQFE